MYIERELKKIRLPKTFMREGKKCYLDRYRKKLIEVTPEEAVRQRVAAYFEKVLNVPRDMIALEKRVDEYGSEENWRCDIIVHKYNRKTDEFVPLAIIECKNADIPLTDNVFEQVVSYRDEIGGDYIVITNGIDLEMYAYSSSKDNYRLLDGVLTYDEMLKGKRPTVPADNDKQKRFNMQELQDRRTLSRYNRKGKLWVFGTETPTDLCAASVNLYQGLLETTRSLPKRCFKNFKMIDDLGVRSVSYKAGLGCYMGQYRSFLVEDKEGDTEIISISVTAKYYQDGKYGYRSYDTYLSVSVDKGKTSKCVLLLDMDKYTEIDGKCLLIFHSGKSGSVSIQAVKSKIEENSSRLRISKGQIVIGKLPIYKLIHLDNPEVAGVMYNLIEYALLREEIRQERKEALANN